MRSRLAEQIFQRPKSRSFLSREPEETVKMFICRADAARFVEHHHPFRHPAHGLAEFRFHVLFPAFAWLGASAFHADSQELRAREVQPPALDYRAVFQLGVQDSRRLRGTGL